VAVNRPIVLSIAGLDPSAGAGLLADIKTFEENKVYGLGICSAQTIQTENEFTSIKWADEKEMMKVLETLLSRYDVQVIKIGVIENIERLKNIISFIHRKNESIKIIWDTVIRSTSGFDFWNGELNEDALKEILKEVFMITPNYNEVTKLANITDPIAAAKVLSVCCNVLLKGGHNEEEKGVDFLMERCHPLEGWHRLEPIRSDISQKHGSGCVLSSAIAANLALGNSLHTSCINAKQYIQRFLTSNDSLLGYHHV
jgi:hydroxymethylpyrimidine/phosphomethylpyrimidine kinase